MNRRTSQAAIIDAYRVSGNKMELFNVAGNPGTMMELRRRSGLSDIAAPAGGIRRKRTKNCAHRW
jgi:hypothetical protein